MTIRKFIPALFLAIACDPDTSDVVEEQLGALEPATA